MAKIPALQKLTHMLPTHPDATLSEKLMMMKDSSAHRLHRPYQRISTISY